MTSSSEMLDAGGGVVDIDNNNININTGLDVQVSGGNIALGNADTFANNVSGYGNLAIGQSALALHQSGSGNQAIGLYALSSHTAGVYNVAIGFAALQFNTVGQYNVAIGAMAGNKGVAVNNNVSVGYRASHYNTSGENCTALGSEALRFNTTGSALSGFDNITGVGANTVASWDNQVQLGDSATTTYAYGAVQNRSDARDKADIIDADLGLDFILALSPKKWRWNYRESYHDQVEGEDGETVLKTIENDGSRKRSRFHHGFIAQEVKGVMDALGVDFGGYQDHSMSDGGCDVLSLGYEEFIAPMVAAIQHQNSLIVDLTTRLEALEA